MLSRHAFFGDHREQLINQGRDINILRVFFLSTAMFFMKPIARSVYAQFFHHVTGRLSLGLIIDVVFQSFYSAETMKGRKFRLFSALPLLFLLSFINWHSTDTELAGAPLTEENWYTFGTSDHDEVLHGQKTVSVGVP